MSYFDRNPQLFRILVGILAAYFLVITGLIFYRYGSAPTDENWFTDPPSNLYVTSTIPTTSDSIQIGDMLVGVNGKRVRNLVDLRKALLDSSATSPVTLDVTTLRQFKQRKCSPLPGVRLEKSIRELPPTAYVFDVIKDGASDRAGMKVGDLIVRINQQTFGTIFQADSILRSGQIGKEIEYVVFRDSREVPLHVTLAAFGFPFPQLVLVGCGFLYMAFGAFVALRRPQLKAARLIGLAFLCLGFMLSASTLSRGLGEGILPFLRTNSFFLSLFFGTALLIHGAQYFPKERPDLVSRPWIHQVAYVLALLSAIAGIVFKDPLVLSCLGVLVLYSIGVRVAFRKHIQPEYKKLNSIIRWASAAAVLGAGGLVAYLNFAARTPDQRFGYIGIPLAVIPVAYLYTIGKYRLLDLSLRIRRNIQYSFASWTWVTLTVTFLLWALLQLPKIHLPLPNVQLTGGSIEIVDEPMGSEYRAMLEKGVLMLLAIGLTFLFRRIGRDGQNFLARKFYRAKYDYRRAANELTEVMATKLNMSELARGIAAKLAELMQLKRTGVLFFRQQKTCCCQEAYGFSNDEWEAFCLSIPDHLIDSMRHFKGEFSVDYLPAGVKDIFRKNGFLIIVPIKSKEKLVGALLLGEKLSESPFQHDDFEFLSAAANQASVSVENAFLYEELAEQDRMKHELELARRIQLDSLPQKTPSIPGLDLAGISIPAMEVGGDYFDYLNGEVNDLTVIVGDVSGKGTPAAIYMSKVQGIIRSLYGFGLSPKEFFIRVNTLLCNDLEKNSFITAIGGFFNINARRIVLARAGHLPLYMYHIRTRSVERILSKGIGFGLSADNLFEMELEEKILHYEIGDVFLFVTDGVTEARRSTGEQYGEDSLIKLLEGVAEMTAGEIRDSVIDSVRAFAGDERQHDDQTVVVVKATR